MTGLAYARRLTQARGHWPSASVVQGAFHISIRWGLPKADVSRGFFASSVPGSHTRPKGCGLCAQATPISQRKNKRALRSSGRRLDGKFGGKRGAGP